MNLKKLELFSTKSLILVSPMKSQCISQPVSQKQFSFPKCRMLAETSIPAPKVKFLANTVFRGVLP